MQISYFALKAVDSMGNILLFCQQTNHKIGTRIGFQKKCQDVSDFLSLKLECVHVLKFF